MDVQLGDPHFQEKMQVIGALYRVIDPELFVNIIDLGLVYGIDFGEEEDITITMTFSTRHCPLGEAIKSGVNNVLQPAFPAKKVDIRIVWDPPWNAAMMTEEGKIALGIGT
jgi:metal-sulfur cluster biosynthetic enzyme